MFLDDLEYKNEKINLSISKVEVTEGLGIPYPFLFFNVQNHFKLLN